MSRLTLSNNVRDAVEYDTEGINMGVRLVVQPRTVIVQVGMPGGGGVVSFETVRAALAEANAAVDLNGQAITGLADPTNPQDAATRAFVLANASNVGSRIDVSGPLTLTESSRGNSYVGAGDITLPASGTIGTGTKWSNRFTVGVGTLRLLRQGTDTINYYGVGLTAYGSAFQGDSVDIEYVGGGVYNVAAVSGQGWTP